MRMDYELFGDIVTFDTTFATNKDHRPLGVFIGFNHYREQVIFGASLLDNETQASFDWIFNTFLEAHKFKKPTTLFTDQDIAMGRNAIHVVMPEAGLYDNLLSSLSQGSNRIQLNDERVFGDFNRREREIADLVARRWGVHEVSSPEVEKAQGVVAGRWGRQPVSSSVNSLSSYKKRKRMEKHAYEEWKSTVKSNTRSKAKAPPAKRTKQARLNFSTKVPESKVEAI
ncbi:hypothetical protein RJ640_004274 [Escallonia rubra]|uniref:MULE transposase domain-containing protein n=1 Tax=Escallonia rubra TaxID=112253 RepID=A0AA88R072_9ASTE|nr:hypothetical protein RJ640_004274 [Escallonia rubra]